MRVEDDNRLPEDVEVHDVACNGTHASELSVHGNTARSQSSPYLALICRSFSGISLLGISSALPKIGSPGGPGGRGRVLRLLAFRTTRRATTPRARYQRAR